MTNQALDREYCRADVLVRWVALCLTTPMLLVGETEICEIQVDDLADDRPTRQTRVK